MSSPYHTTLNDALALALQTMRGGVARDEDADVMANAVVEFALAAAKVLDDQEPAPPAQTSTLWSGKRSAEVCRINGWGPGTRLVGDERGCRTVIEITAVGEWLMLAKTISQNGEAPKYESESSWTLDCREWAVVL